MIDAVENRHLGKVEGTDAIQASDVHTILVLIGAALMMGVDPALGTEKMLRRSGVETVACQCVLASQYIDPAHIRGDRHRAPHPAIGTGASADGVEPIGKLHFKPNRTAMALPGSRVRVACHVRQTSNQSGPASILRTIGSTASSTSALSAPPPASTAKISQVWACASHPPSHPAVRLPKPMVKTQKPINNPTSSGGTRRLISARPMGKTHSSAMVMTI